MNVEFCQRALWLAEPSCRGILPSVLCLNVCGLEYSKMRRPTPGQDFCATVKRNGIRCSEEQYEKLLYFSVFATCLSIRFFTVIFCTVFRRLGAMYIFKSIFFLNLFYKIYRKILTFISGVVLTALEHFTFHYPSPQSKQVYFKTTRALSNCLTLHLRPRIYIYIYVCVCVCVCVYIYIYIYI